MSSAEAAAQGNWCGREEEKKAGRSLSQVDFCVCQLNELKSRGRWTWWNPTNAVRRLQDIFVCFSQQLAAVTTFIHHWPTCKWPAHDESAAFRVASPTVSIDRRLQGGSSSALAARCPTSVCKTKPQPKSRRITWSTVRLAPKLSSGKGKTGGGRK